jgi:hypothetical protein
VPREQQMVMMMVTVTLRLLVRRCPVECSVRGESGWLCVVVGVVVRRGRGRVQVKGRKERPGGRARLGYGTELLAKAWVSRGDQGPDRAGT